MRLSQNIVDRLKNDQDFRLRLAVEMKVAEAQIRYLIARNTENGNLTKLVAINFFKGNGYSEKQILEPKKLSKSA